jgi:hypothetical protein
MQCIVSARLRGRDVDAIRQGGHLQIEENKTHEAFG